MNKYPSCSGSCGQGRENCDCDCAEFPAANGITALIAVVLVAAAAAASYFFPLGFGA